MISFTPSIPGEENEDLLKSNDERQTLFCGKTFYFCNKSQVCTMKIINDVAVVGQICIL